MKIELSLEEMYQIAEALRFYGMESLCHDLLMKVSDTEKVEYIKYFMTKY